MREWVYSSRPCDNFLRKVSKLNITKQSLSGKISERKLKNSLKYVQETNVGKSKTWDFSISKLIQVQISCWFTILFLRFDIIIIIAFHKIYNVLSVFLQHTWLFSFLFWPTEVSPILHMCHMMGTEMIHFIHQMQYYITFEVHKYGALLSLPLFPRPIAFPPHLTD